MDSTVVINHHAGQQHFSGPVGLALGLAMAAGGGGAARLIADVAGVRAGDRVVDVGCGPGTAAREAARRGAEATGVDPSPSMVRLARQLTRGVEVRWETGAAEEIPLPDASADVLWAIATVHHWQDVGRAVAEARRVLAPGGRLLAMERLTTAGARGLASHGWTEEQADAFAALCREAGFADVRVERHRLGRGERIVVRGRVEG